MDRKKLYKIMMLLTICLSGTATADENIFYPVVFEKQTSGYGNRIHPIYKTKKFHEGVDLVTKADSNVNSIAKGLVVFTGKLGGYGNTIVIEHAGGITSHYCHLQKIIAKAGEILPAGTVIGVVGSSGNTTGKHLHFEMRKKGTPINPEILFPALKN